MSLKISGCDYCGTGWTGKEVPHPKLKCPECRIEDLESRLAEREKELAKAKDEIRQINNGREVWKQRAEMLDKERDSALKELAEAKDRIENVTKAAETYREGLVKAQDYLKESHADYDAARSMAEKLAEALRHCIDIHLKYEVIAGPRKALSLFEQMKKGTV